ncbi:MAG: DUF3048 domain-containing protein [Actinobacteria bacterium]|nr:DUF3048 domain-containing protein [Actinomycetota bacterium]
MVKKVFKKTKVLILFGLVLVLALTMGLAGCKKQQVVETISETTIQEEETSSDTNGQTTQETDDKISGMEITGNINILTGMEISDKVLNSRPLAIMVENTPDARPQSGLINADVVFEVVDEWNVTRFVAVFSSYDSDLVGPVRSARPYYAEIARSFDPIYVFWGTHPIFYKVIENLGLDYLSPLGDKNSSITANFVDPGRGGGEGADAIRDTSRDVAFEHTAYVRLPRMKEIASKLGYKLEGGQSSFHFKIDSPESDRGDISKITIDYSIPQYKSLFEYDSKNNKYVKSVAGSPSTDRESGEQIAVNNVIVMVTDIKETGNTNGHMIVRTTQEGEAFYFFDGKVTEGTWSRSSALDPFTFKDIDGNVVLFNRGNTWVGVISGIDRVDYQ